ncbi:MAG: hypothetical protein DRG25_05940 [Deltaproteobacteria bacterium]|nr:MAG: hypothetical protein DRG25_05940 [Deltaproteobacteria bacterium]
MAGEKVLLVDDTRLNRELAKDILEIEGYKVIEAGNGKEALNRARQNNPDIILLDIELPDINGLEVAKLLKEDPQTRGIPIVALTAHHQPDDQSSFLAAGCVGFISKPFDIKTFPKMLANFLK